MAADYDYERDDPTFIADLRKSREAVDVAAGWLSEHGYPVIVRPTFERPHVGVKSEFADTGDLEIVQRVEVKRRVDMDFTSKTNFPYPTVIVDACHCFDNAKPKPYAYFVFNRSMTAALIVNTRETAAQWIRTSKFDNKKQRTRSFYECAIECTTFVEI